MQVGLTYLVGFVSLVIFSFTAYYSEGFFHSDEHYQVIEFAGLKSGWNSPQDLAWEYHAQIRSGLLPSLAYVLFKISSLLQISDIYTSLFVLRLTSGMFCLASLFFFYRKTRGFLFKKPESASFLQTTYLALLLLMWYIPFLSVRFSSETWSASCLLFALGCYFEIGKHKYMPFLIGILLGLSFLLRFQMAFGIIGIGVYHWIFGEKKLKTTGHILLGFSMILFIGILIDRWFYSEWIFTPWNYFWLFFENDVLNGIESSFSSSSSLYYLEALYQLPTHFIGVLVICCLIISLVFRAKNPVIWFIVPFVAIHCLIPHKEERFLFPIVFFFPFFILLVLLLLYESKKYQKVLKTFVYGIIAVLFFINTIGLFYMIPKSAGRGRTKITHYIHSHYSRGKIHLLHTPFANPYDPWESLMEKYYLEKNIEFQKIDNLAYLSDSMLQPGKIHLLVLRGFDIDHNYLPGNIEKLGFRLAVQSVSRRERSMNRYVKGFENQDVLYLYEWKKP